LFFKVFALLVALGAFCVALYTTTLGPKNALHSERIKLAAKALESTNAYGWALGTFVGKPDQRPFTNEELHSGEPDKIVVIFNGATADLISLELILPDDFTGQVKDLIALLYDVQVSFQNGKFSELAAKFATYRTKVDSLRGRLRAFLV
jgi:hypothetical protein